MKTTQEKMQQAETQPQTGAETSSPQSENFMGEDTTAQTQAEQLHEQTSQATAAQANGAQGDAAMSKLEEELKAVNDKYLRLYAEFENFRRRTAKENFELVATANAKLITKLTEVLDNFSLAFDPKNKGASADDFEKGVKLIYTRFQQLLEDEGLESIDPVNAEFDPNMHEALMQQPSDKIPENHVAQVLLKGYKLKGKILKHAKVIVSQGKA